MDSQDMNQYLKIVIQMSFDTNKYINDMEPWALKKTNLDRMNTVLYVALDQIRKISKFRINTEIKKTDKSKNTV